MKHYPTRSISHIDPGLRYGYRFRLLLLLPMLAGLLSACVYLRSATVPIPGAYYHQEAANDTLVVLLPGMGGSPQNFLDNGVVDTIRRCRPDANIIGVDAHFGYYRERIVLQRLRDDILKPARDSGVDEVWLLGVSMGGIGSLLFRQQHPGEISGVILMAPYIGDREDVLAYSENPQKARLDADPDFVALWDNLVSTAATDPGITLAFGEDDSSNFQHRWLADRLDPARVVSSPGGHRWTVWRTLWPQAIARSGMCSVNS